MPTSNAGNPNLVGTPRIQISLNKDQRKNMTSAAAASVTPFKADEMAAIATTVVANPPLYKSVRKALKNKTLNFKINTECTSLKISPSGNFLWGGFSDGTLRVWDLSGTFGVEDDDVIASRQKTDVLVNSKLTQGYGAVACQIHARGVHTDLITTIDISDDAQYVFLGVARGAVELHAVFIGDLERAVHTHKQREREPEDPHCRSSHKKKRNILDYLKVYYHSDAKLKGFGACANMRSENPSMPTSYFLLTGKGIKNIHIWKFTPPEHPNSSDDEDSCGRNHRESICEPPDDDEDHGIWDQLYDTATNGNSILLLGFYRNPQKKLLAVSKSDAQKLRLWDISFEEGPHPSETDRPKKPPYKDVANSQSALDIAGGIGVCGGGNMYNQMKIVSLDKPDDPFNHTELALPSGTTSSAEASMHQVYSSRRQRRGEMKAVVNVATSQRDSSHALLELDDGSLVGFSAGSSSSKDSSGSLPRLALATPESTGIPALPADFWRRCSCLENIAGVVIAASSLYNPNTNKGQLVIRALGGLKKPRGSEVQEKKKIKKQQQKQRERERLQREKDEALLLEQLQKQREKHYQQNQTIAQPKTPSPIHTAGLQSSPVQADMSALRDAVSGPKTAPVSVLRTEKNSVEPVVRKTTDCKITIAAQSSTATSTHVSPNGGMETPRGTKNAKNEQNDSPDSTGCLPKISKFLQPKRIDMQAQNLQEHSKKRKVQEPKEVDVTQRKSVSAVSEKESKKARKATTIAESVALATPYAVKRTIEKATPANENSPMPVVQLNSIGSVKLNTIGSIPFKSPKPQAKKKSMLVVAPSKPKKPAKPAIAPAASFSTPKASQDARKDSKMNVETFVVPKTPISKNSSTPEESKRDRTVVETDVPVIATKKIARSNAEVSTALFLTALASPQPPTGANSNATDEILCATPKTSNSKVVNTEASEPKGFVTSVAKSKMPGDLSFTKIVPPPSKKAPVARLKGKFVASPSTLPQASREEILHEKISEQYNQLRTFLKGITDQSMALIHSRNLRGPVPSALVSKATKYDTAHLSAYSKLLTEHRAAHDYLQRRLLKSAETTLRLVLDSRITAEVARTELKQNIKKFEEILCDTLHRQERERLSVAAQHFGTPSKFVQSRKLPKTNNDQDSESTGLQSNYPCKEAFDKVEDICNAITRPVGRPRNA